MIAACSAASTVHSHVLTRRIMSWIGGSSLFGIMIGAMSAGIDAKRDARKYAVRPTKSVDDSIMLGSLRLSRISRNVAVSVTSSSQMRAFDLKTWGSLIG